MPSTGAIVAFIAAGSVAVGGVGVATAVAVSTSGTDATVVKIVDGDTLDVSYEGGTHRVRLLNVDTPETGGNGKDAECLASEATSFLKDRLPVGSTVELNWDKDRLDRYDRQLRGVYDGEGDLVNTAIVRAGLALPMHLSPNYRYRDDVDEAYAEASRLERGLFDPAHGCTLAARSDRVNQAVQGGDHAAAVKEATALHAILRDPDSFAGRLMGVDERSAAIRNLTEIISTHKPKPKPKPTPKRAATSKSTVAPSPQPEPTASVPTTAPAPRPSTPAPRPSTPAPAPAPQPTTAPPAPRTTSAPPPPVTTPAAPKPRPSNAAPCRSYAPGGKSFTYIDCDTKQPI